MARFAVLFFVILVAAFAAELTPPVQRAVVEPWTNFVAKASTSLMRVFDPAVVVNGPTIISKDNGFGVTILAGCNGLEAMIVLLAAILAFPARWKHKLVGLAAGILAIQLLNFVRIASLFYLGQWSPTAFEWAHLYVWQVLIMLDALIVFLVWLRSLPRLPLTPDGLARA